MSISTFTCAEERSPALESQVQNLKKEVLDLNKELFILEEDLLFPANTQFSIFLSMDIGQLFDLDSVQINIDGKNISNHLYTQREINALKRGGVQRVYLGNIASGKHELVAFFTGKGPNKRAYKRGTTIEIEKTSSPLFVELKIIDNLSKQQPEFKTKVWE
ncbi:MAG: AraC family transcriptional regulator [Gammaproteobacteria bacterium]|nr:AraC family transcriptional regulator [Gammaproteobacteria bacterium]MCW8988821.1 AraC family transcriptional regulator [Gammaproteobacteria bacterium]MCW9032027.1 AraC family transcriptional regulator [Gammaproteobacteria bacterium]